MQHDQIVSFRHLLAAEVGAFLGAEGMSCEGTTDALVEMITSLSRYQEEGSALFPIVFLCDDLEVLSRTVRGLGTLAIGKGPRDAETARRALKQCAPLARSEWSIVIERGAGELRYGLLRTDAFVLFDTPMQLLRASTDASVRAIGIAQLGDSVVELRGASGAVRFVYLTGTPLDGPPRPIVLRGLLDALVRDVEPTLRRDTQTFYRRVFVDVMRSAHGTLGAVLPVSGAMPTRFADGLHLAEPLDVPASIAAYRATRSDDDRARVQSNATLLRNMLGFDGITLMRTDGAILAYNVFVPHTPLDEVTQRTGGARHRSYELLAHAVGHDLTAAFYRSQDGNIQCRARP